MLNENVKNSDIIAKAEEIKQIIIDRSINALTWTEVFDKYSIKQGQVYSIVSLVKNAEDYIRG